MQGRIRTAIACAGALLTVAAPARAQTTYRETGSVTIGNNLVWVRGTNASSVELFIGRGFRDAFAHAHEMDAAKLQHWIDSVRTIAPLPADDTTSASARANGAALGPEVTMTRRVGGAYSGLRLQVSGEEPIQMAEPIARDFLVMLDSAARVSLDMSKPGPSLMVGVPAPEAPAPAAPAPALVVAATPPQAAPAATVVAPPAPPAPPPPPAATPTPAPPAAAPLIGVPTTTTVIGVPPDSIAAAEPPTSSPEPSTVATASATPPAAPATPSMGPSTSDAAPELVLPAPQEPVLLLASRVDIMPLPVPPVPALAPRTVETPPVASVTVAPPAPESVPPTASADSAAPPAAPAAPPAPAAPTDKLIHTPLGPFTVPGALLADRDKEAQYCYTQLGLRYNPDLKGEITVALSLANDGTVQDAVVTKRSWQGISAGEVESCVRALARDWTFAATDPSIVGGAKLLTFSFAP